MAEQVDTGRTPRAPGAAAGPEPAVEPGAQPPGGRSSAEHAPGRARSRSGGRKRSTDEVPEPAAGVDLIGEYEASGYKEAPCLVRRQDGQTIQLTPLLYATLELIDGRRRASEIAAALSDRMGRAVSADNVLFLVDEKLRPTGLVKGRDGREPQVQKANPLLALRLRLQVTDERWTNRLAAPFGVLFRPWIVLPAVLAFIGVVAWVLGSRGLGGGARQLFYSPGLMLLTFGLMVVSASFHEFGHAAACRYSGGRPGGMGCGLYLVWPAFYTDVTDAYRLDRTGRLRTDLGGLYFNALFALATFGFWVVTRVDAVLLLIPLQVLQMMHQLLPFVRLDGYHILSDLVGVPDLFARIKPSLLSLVPGRRANAKAAVLKPWVRVVVALWVLTVVPLLVFSLLMVVITAPRAIATAWDSVGIQWRNVSRAFDTGEWASVAAGAIGVIATALPVLGSGYAVSRFGRRAWTWGWTAAGKARLGRPALAVLGIATAAALAFLLWPNGEYRPIQPGERGTIAEAVEAVTAVDTGRPGLTPEREADLGGAPSQAWTVSEGPVEPLAATPAEEPSTTPTTEPSVTTGADETPVPTTVVRPTTTLDPPTPTTTEPIP